METTKSHLQTTERGLCFTLPHTLIETLEIYYINLSSVIRQRRKSLPVIIVLNIRVIIVHEPGPCTGPNHKKSKNKEERDV